MAIQKGWKVNVNRCFSCRACEMACKVEYSLAAGEGRRRRVIEKSVVLTGTGSQIMPVATIFIPSACNQCVDPSCVKACPKQALKKTNTRAEFNSYTGAGITVPQYAKIQGIVLHNPETCVGCRRCEAACPYGAPQYNPTTHKVHKCELCWQRVTDVNSIGYGADYAIPACQRQCGGSLSQRLDSESAGRPTFSGPLDLKHGPALEMVTVDPSLATQSFTGETGGVYRRAGAGSGNTGADGGSGRSLGSRFLQVHTLTNPALVIRNREYLSRTGSVID